MMDLFVAGPSRSAGSLVKLLKRYLISTSIDGGEGLNQDDMDRVDIADKEDRIDDAMEMESEESDDLNI